MKIKDLRDKIESIKNDIKQTESTIAGQSKRLETLSEVFDRCVTELESLERGEFDLKVSDHCLMRYFERVEEMDFDPYREKIVSTEVKKQYALYGDGSYFNEFLNCFVVVKNDTVVTLHYKDYDIKGAKK